MHPFHPSRIILYNFFLGRLRYTNLFYPFKMVWLKVIQKHFSLSFIVHFMSYSSQKLKLNPCLTGLMSYTNMSTSNLIQPSYTISAAIFEKVFRPKKLQDVNWKCKQNRSQFTNSNECQIDNFPDKAEIAEPNNVRSEHFDLQCIFF